MFKRTKMIVLIIIFFSIILYGTLTINNRMANNIKSIKPVYATFTLNPLSLNLNVGDYTIYINDQVILGMETPVKNLEGNIENKFGEVTKNVITWVYHISK